MERWVLAVARYRFLVLALFLALLVANTFILNDFDALIRIRGIEFFLEGRSPHAEPDFINPPHTMYVAIPFVYIPYLMWGIKGIAALNAFFLLILLGSSSAVFVLFSPFFVVSIGEGNLFSATALGLLILIRARRGFRRGLAWALLLMRPQDAVLILIADGMVALRQRDWLAFLTAACLVLPPLAIYGQEWLGMPELKNLQEYTLSVRENYGFIFAVFYFLLLVGLRAVRRDCTLRPWYAYSRSERFWLLLVAGWVFVSPYVTIYQLVFSLLLLRVFNPKKKAHLWRMLLLYGALFVVFILFFSDPRGFENDLWQEGFLLFPLLLALLAPKN